MVTCRFFLAALISSPVTAAPLLPAWPWLALAATGLTALASASWRAYQRTRREAELAIAGDGMTEEMLDQSSQLIGLLSTQGLVLRLNHAAQEWLGPAAHAAAGQALWDLPAWLQAPADADKLRLAVARAADGRPQQVEIGVGARRMELSVRPMRRRTAWDSRSGWSAASIP